VGKAEFLLLSFDEDKCDLDENRSKRNGAIRRRFLIQRSRIIEEEQSQEGRVSEVIGNWKGQAQKIWKRAD